MNMRHIIEWQNAAADLSELGGKAAALAALGEHGLPIPPWFVVKTSAWRQEGETPELAPELQTALAAFAADDYFAVRSSAKAEDGAENSFAGQFETYLWVRREDVAAKIRAVWRSAFSERVRAYCAHNHIPPPAVPPAVLVQRMVKSEQAGVAFAADPVCADTGTCVTAAVFGLGSALVDGASDADTYTYRYATGEITARIAPKNIAAEPLNRVVCPMLFERDLSRERALTDAQAAAVAMLAKRASNLCGRFQDIEWAFEGGELWLLQSRPITTLGGVFESRSRAYVFDNSNIAESYRGATTPLTFSFIRKAYAGVYEQFCRVFGVSEKIIAGHAGVFSRMLAFLDNRVYYNLHSWYKMLSLLPGYTVNRTFMEQMMGVKEPLPEAFLRNIHAGLPRVGKLTDAFRLLRCLFKLTGNYIRLENHIARFYARLDAALEGPPPENLDANGLADAFARMEKGLLLRWDAPIENDFFAMIFHGLLRSLCKKYGLPDDFHNELLRSQGGVVSAEPAREIHAIGRSIAQDPAVIETLTSGGLGEINRMLARNESLRERTEDYLSRFGDRCVDELKLESVTLTEQPLPFYRAIGAMAGREPDCGPPAPRQAPDWRPRLKGHPLRRAIFAWVLKNARRTVKNRENLRFDRTRLFGRVRRVFLALGAELASRGALESRRDVFYLTLDELLGTVDATAASRDLKAIVALRKAERQKNDACSSPTRVLINGIAGISGRQPGAPAPIKTGDSLMGVPCCAGQVQAVARVVDDPGTADFAPGQILVAASTDPGWIVLFSLAAGLVVERGSLLSHAAIVSREMGIPCIISAAGATRLIPDGAVVRMDGATGSISVLEGPHG
ncbi:MAG: hypothetical protein LBH21_01805 [Gracilibacteraceae bacterium]|nr:hypothetical protein [Gracilibacteraceae bacterium]